MKYSPIVDLTFSGKKAIKYMKAKGYKIRALNIIYFEGINPDLVTVNKDRIDEWNDVRAIIADTGDVLMAAIATSEPGWHYRNNPMNSNGAAQLAFGQYLDAWCIGNHFEQDALVQCGELKVYRDKNQDGSRSGDLLYVGKDFGLNQHTTSNAPDAVGKWSAGCLVGKFPETHAKFMAMCRSMGLKTFDSTLVAGDEFAKFS